MSLRTDERAQSIGLSRFFLSVFVVGSLLFFIMSQLGVPLLQGAKNSTGNATANQATNWFLDFVGLIPVIMILVGFLGVILLAVWQREVFR